MTQSCVLHLRYPYLTEAESKHSVFVFNIIVLSPLHLPIGRKMTNAEKGTVATELPPEPAPAVEDPPAIPKEVEDPAPPTEPAAQPPLSEASSNPAALQWKEKASVFLTTSSKTESLSTSL